MLLSKSSFALHAPPKCRDHPTGSIFFRPTSSGKPGLGDPGGGRVKNRFFAFVLLFSEKKAEKKMQNKTIWEDPPFQTKGSLKFPASGNLAPFCSIMVAGFCFVCLWCFCLLFPVVVCLCVSATPYRTLGLQVVKELCMIRVHGVVAACLHKVEG